VESGIMIKGRALCIELQGTGGGSGRGVGVEAGDIAMAF